MKRTDPTVRRRTKRPFCTPVLYENRSARPEICTNPHFRAGRDQPAPHLRRDGCASLLPICKDAAPFQSPSCAVYERPIGCLRSSALFAAWADLSGGSAQEAEFANPERFPDSGHSCRVRRTSGSSPEQPSLCDVVNDCFSEIAPRLHIQGLMRKRMRRVSSFWPLISRMKNRVRFLTRSP